MAVGCIEHDAAVFFELACDQGAKQRVGFDEQHERMRDHEIPLSSQRTARLGPMRNPAVIAEVVIHQSRLVSHCCTRLHLARRCAQTRSINGARVGAARTCLYADSFVGDPALRRQHWPVRTDDV